MDIEKTMTKEPGSHPPADELGFGKYFTDHMFLVDHSSEKGWHDPRIVPYGPLAMDPAAMVLHYNQEVFEGLKAYQLEDGGIGLFRPERNIDRMNTSARRMVMPEMEPDLCLEAMEKLVLTDRDWLPSAPGTSLYLRPTMIATEAALGVRPATEFLFYIILSPVGAYYAGGFKPTRIEVSDEHVRAFRGGVGNIKTSGNYGPTLLAQQEAKERGFNQVLWLDAGERRYAEEIGTSNIFFVIGETLRTPPLSGTILEGITRDSVLKIAGQWEIPTELRSASMEEVTAAAEDGSLREVFATGTAAVISPVGSISYRGKEIRVGDGEVGELSRKFYDELTGIQYGSRPDPFGWVRRIA